MSHVALLFLLYDNALGRMFTNTGEDIVHKNGMPLSDRYRGLPIFVGDTTSPHDNWVDQGTGLMLCQWRERRATAQAIAEKARYSETTFGAKAVGLSFNPSGDQAVYECKLGYAQIIDQMHALREQSTDPEQKRLCSVAITEAQTAQMWAVKALTWRV